MDDDTPRVGITQAERIISKFGGPRKLAGLIGRDVATVYKWLYSKERGGTGGLIPSTALREILKAARHEGILITPQDLYPTRG